MKLFTSPTAFVVLGLVESTWAAYSLTDNYGASNFFSGFNFITGNDPTNGFVNYVDQATAQSQGLINTNNNKIYMGVDHTTTNPGGRGRNSVRIESKKQYTHGLFLLDLNHMPGGICGVWPAFWTYGPNWPNSGEIDVLEGVNSQTTDFVTLHTGGTCSAVSGGFSGQLSSSNCDTNTGGSSGCSIHSSNSATYGAGLNNLGGGVYAMEWLSTGIKVWFFARNAGIPSDITSGNPNPSSWSTPIASFPGGSNCNIDSNFMNHWVVFDTTFCGDWAGSSSVWSSDPVCGSKASSCQAYVAGNPSAFTNAYWSINTVKIYTSSGTMNAESSSNSTQPDQPVVVSQADSSATPQTSGFYTATQPAQSLPSSQTTANEAPTPTQPTMPTSQTTSGHWWHNKPSKTQGTWDWNHNTVQTDESNSNSNAGRGWSGHWSAHRRRQARAHGHGRRIDGSF